MLTKMHNIAVICLGLAFIAAGTNHFVNPDLYISIMPDYLPAHAALVVMSGLFEILGGVGVLIPRTRKLAGIGLMLLIIAVFPANLNMALYPERFPDIPLWALYLRLPLQLLILAWAYLAVSQNTPE